MRNILYLYIDIISDLVMHLKSRIFLSSLDVYVPISFPSDPRQNNAELNIDQSLIGSLPSGPGGLPISELETDFDDDICCWVPTITPL